MWPDLPGEIWALAGIIVTALIAYIRERLTAQASPYDQMANRLARVEEKAELVAPLTARMSILVDWVEDAASWMTEIEAAWHDEFGEHYIPAPPLPPPRWERREQDIGHWPERRHGLD